MWPGESRTTSTTTAAATSRLPGWSPRPAWTGSSARWSARASREPVLHRPSTPRATQPSCIGGRGSPRFTLSWHPRSGDLGHVPTARASTTNGWEQGRCGQASSACAHEIENETAGPRLPSLLRRYTIRAGYRLRLFLQSSPAPPGAPRGPQAVGRRIWLNFPFYPPHAPATNLLQLLPFHCYWRA